MRKVLYSPGFGAGWASWNDDKVGKFMAEYPPLINAVENGEPTADVIKTMVLEIKQKFGEDTYVCILGTDRLEVAVVSGPYIITEYDGSESVIEASSVTWW